MADKSYDVIIIGGGAKGLAAAAYLTKYGKMDVAIFDKRHELGGGWATEECMAGGFLYNTHCLQYPRFYLAAFERDFPELRELGAYWIPYPFSSASIYKEDQSCLVIYGDIADPTYERTHKEIARFSKRDADTWVDLKKRWDEILKPAFIESVNNPVTPLGVPGAFDKALADPRAGIDPIWFLQSPLQALGEMFESNELIAALLRAAHSIGGFSPDTPAQGLDQIVLSVSMYEELGFIHGGTHSLAHATYKIVIENGGKTFTEHDVDKVIIENGRATGVRLTDGSEIEARKFVLSTLDPYSLCFKLIGEELLDWKLLRRVQNLSRRMVVIDWYGWALKERPEYLAADFNPDVGLAGQILLINKDPEALIKECAWRRLDREAPEPLLALADPSLADNTFTPDERKCSICAEDFTFPAYALDEKGWREYKKSHAELMLKTWQQYAPNVTWDNVIGYYPITPFDTANGLSNMGPEGNWAIIDWTPSQIGRNRPVPELAQHRTPIKNLYATGSAWPGSGGGNPAPGYTLYKIIAEDFQLEEKQKPWVGQPY